MTGFLTSRSARWAIAAVMKLNSEMPLVMVITVISAVLLLRTGQNTKIKGDAAIAMISVGALAIGYLLMNIFSTSSNLSGDVCSTLFGSTSDPDSGQERGMAVCWHVGACGYGVHPVL